ncbi:MAG: 4a-hydroxytetrahydrobiopterin dehydratase [Gallionella sp.]
MNSSSELTSRRCKPCQPGTPPLSNSEADSLIRQLDGWKRYDRLISKTYDFKDYYECIAFVNSVAWLSHREDHHPNLTVSYNKCQVEYSTHSVHGLSENDFICAAKVDALFKI